MKQLIFAVIGAFAVVGGTATVVNFGTQPAYVEPSGGGGDNYGDRKGLTQVRDEQQNANGPEQEADEKDNEGINHPRRNRGSHSQIT